MICNMTLVEKNPERIAAVYAFKNRFVSFMNKMREMGHLIIHLKLVNLPDDPNVERYNGFLPVQKGTHGENIISDFLHPADIVVEKNKDNGFYATELDHILNQNDVDTVIITGMQTQICVQTMAADAFFRGYNVWVPTDGVVSAYDEDKDKDKERALTWLAGYCATVCSSNEILHTLVDKGHLPRKDVKIP